MLSWPSSQRIRYRGEGSPRSTSSITPERGRRSIDSDSATTRLPTLKTMLNPPLSRPVEDRPVSHLPQRPVPRIAPAERCPLRTGAGVSRSVGRSPHALLSLSPPRARTRPHGGGSGAQFEKDGQAARRKAAPPGAAALKGSLLVSLCQIAWVKRLATSIWASLAPRCLPSRRFVSCSALKRPAPGIR